MAFESIDQARVLQFAANVTHLFQQKGSKLRGLVREESLKGKAHFFERLAAEDAVELVARHADTPQLDPAHSRRMVVPKDYAWSAKVWDPDKLRHLISAASEYAIAASSALNRSLDRAILTAFDADAAGGESGTSAITFASEAAADTDPSAAAVTTANILALKKALDVQEVPMEDRYIVVHPAVVTQLLGATSAPLAASSDYNTVKALVQGDLDTWVGFKWIQSTLVPVAAGTDVYCYAWHKSAIGLAINAEITGRMSELPGKNYSTQVYARGTFGATRILGNGVCRMRIDSAL